MWGIWENDATRRGRAQYIAAHDPCVVFVCVAKRHLWLQWTTNALRSGGGGMISGSLISCYFFFSIYLLFLFDAHSLLFRIGWHSWRCGVVVCDGCVFSLCRQPNKQTRFSNQEIGKRRRQIKRAITPHLPHTQIPHTYFVDCMQWWCGLCEKILILFFAWWWSGGVFARRRIVTMREM